MLSSRKYDEYRKGNERILGGSEFVGKGPCFVHASLASPCLWNEGKNTPGEYFLVLLVKYNLMFLAGFYIAGSICEGYVLYLSRF